MSLKPLKNEGINLVWKAWKMPDGANPPIKPEGYGEQAKEYLGELLSKSGLEIKSPSAKRNTFLAHVGGKLVEKIGIYTKYQERIFEAIWKYDENIEDEDILISIGEELGLNPIEFKQALHDEKYIQKVHEDFKTATELEIWTIPSYVGSKGVLQVHHFKDIPSLEQLRKIL